MKQHIYLSIIALATFICGCEGEGETYFYGFNNPMSSPSVNYRSANSITLSGYTSGEGIAILDESNNETMMFPYSTYGYNHEINRLRPNTYYKIAFYDKDAKGGIRHSSYSYEKTNDYNNLIKGIETTQVTYYPGTVEYDTLIIGDENMYRKVAVRLQDDNEIWNLRPNTTYSWTTVARDLFGHKYQKPVDKFKTPDYDMYMESVSYQSAVFNAGTVYYTTLYLSDKSDMSNILLSSRSYSRTHISGLTPSKNYYLQTEATDIFGQIYRSPIYNFKTTDFEVITEAPKTTSATAQLKARLNGDVSNHVFTVYFEVYKNGYYELATEATYDSSTKTYYADLAILNRNSTYKYKAVVKVNGRDYVSGEMVDITLDSHHPAEAVDLGLSVKWASWNIGARSPEEDGGLYAYGDYLGEYYVTSNLSQSDISGTYSDPARRLWGGNWRLPTSSETYELYINCAASIDYVNGVKGYRYTSKKNGNSIFFPAAGYRQNSAYKAIDKGSYMSVWGGTVQKPTWEWRYYNANYFWCNDNSYSYDYANYTTGRSLRPVCQ